MLLTVGGLSGGRLCASNREVLRLAEESFLTDLDFAGAAVFLEDEPLGAAGFFLAAGAGVVVAAGAFASSFIPGQSNIRTTPSESRVFLSRTFTLQEACPGTFALTS